VTAPPRARSAAARAGLALFVLAPILALALAVGLASGAVPISLWTALAGKGQDASILRELRLPRVLLAAEVGAALSIAGVALQALLRNPLADPFVFGLSGGAAIGTSLAVIAAGTTLGGVAGTAASWVGVLPVQLSACVGAFGAAVFVYALGRSRGQLVPERALLLGVVFNSFASALVLGLQAMLAPEKMQGLLLWLSGTLGYEAAPVLALAGASVLVPALILTSLAGRLNLLALGDESAMALGVDVGRTRGIAFAAASIAVGVAVALTGLVGFVGLLVPHAVRLVTGPDHRVLLPASALGGAAFLVLADAAARMLFRGLGTEPPVGAVTAVLGAPLFVLLLRRQG
jgi:iron complex transport system permease protein